MSSLFSKYELLDNLLIICCGSWCFGKGVAGTIAVASTCGDWGFPTNSS